MLTTITQENSKSGYAFNSVGPFFKNSVLVLLAETWENSIIHEWYFGQKQQEAESIARLNFGQKQQRVETIVPCSTCEEYSIGPLSPL